MRKISIIKIAIFAFVVLLFNACEKEAGEGGNSSIYGKVWVKDCNATFSLILNRYWGQDEDVFIVYGNNKSYSDKVSSNFDGTFEFKYLRPGKYTIYAYSKDSAGYVETLNPALPLLPVVKTLEITDNDQEVNAGTIEIFN
jgi:hypothetical protein